MPTGSVAIQLGVPLYAVHSALEDAYVAGEVEHAAGAGWKALTPAEPAPEATDGQMNVGGGW